MVGVAAAGQAPGGERPAGQFNLLEIDGEQGQWRIALKRHGLSRPGSGVELIEEKTLVGGMAAVG